VRERRVSLPPPLPPRGTLADRVGATRRELRGAFRGTREQAEKTTRAIVVGGGLAGVSAALVLAERGVRVTLVEREKYLGGRIGSFAERLPAGDTFQMERGFPAFFRHYYNLRAILQRVDPELSALRPLADYPVLGPDGAMESFVGLPTTAPLNLLALLRRTPFVSLADLRHLDGETVRAMIAFDPQKSYARHDVETARAYLDRLNLPARAREMVFRVFCHSVFHGEEHVSAAEMLSMLHFYFLGNPEGMSFDVLDEPTGDILFSPLERLFATLGVDVQLGTTVLEITRERGDKVRARTDVGELEADGLVLATEVSGLRAIFDASPQLGEDPSFAASITGLATSAPYVVHRIFFDRPVTETRAPFASIAGHGSLDSITLYDRFEGESRRFSLRTGGSVVQLSAFGLDPSQDDGAVRTELKGALRSLYPELKDARAIHEVYLRKSDCPAFAPGSHATRPRVATPYGNIALAGDYVKVPFPSALMERAASSGIMAANVLLDRWDVRGEPIYTIPPRGFIASLGLRA
jgi:isorenieratene synthase